MLTQGCTWQVLSSIFHVAEDQAVSAAVVEHQEHHQLQKAKRHEKLARIPCVGGCLNIMQEVELDTLTVALVPAPAPAPAPALVPALAVAVALAPTLALASAQTLALNPNPSPCPSPNPNAHRSKCRWT